MRRCRLAAFLLALFLLTAGLPGCAGAARGGDGTRDPAAQPSGGLRLNDGYVPRTVDTGSALTPRALAAAGDFAAALFRESLAGDGKNTLLSPLPVFLALGMAANGAAGDTLAAFEQVLGGGALSREDLNLFCLALAERLPDVSGSTVLHIANGVWYREDFDPEAAFLQANADYFGAEARRAPFGPDTVREINAWVSDSTEDMIPGILDSLDPQDVMVLVNTLYMKNTWQQQFEPHRTHPGEFTLTGGGKVRADFMSGSAGTLLSCGSAEGVLLPYDDGRTAFAAVLPPEGVTAREYAASLDGAALRGLWAGAGTEQVQLYLPKFNAACDAVLNEPLTAMGLGAAFDAEAADFAPMGKSALGKVCIGLAVHKTRIEVAEKGTEAAAAAGLTVSAAGIPPPQPKIIRFDRPFLYGIIDLESGLPLFLGVLENPAG